MAHQSRSLSALQALTNVSSSANQVPLDLNLSQKASQNPLKGHDETGVSHQKALDAITTPYLVTPQLVNVAHDRLTSSGHSSIESNLQGAITPEKPLVESGAAAATRESLQNSITVIIDDKVPIVNGLVPTSAGRKRKSPRVEAAANVQKERLQAETSVLNDSPPEANGLTPERNRKSPRVKQQTPDAAKKVILALEAKEDEVATKPRSRSRPSQPFKDMATPCSRGLYPDIKAARSEGMVERRLLLEERKVRLAEQRFALEERKLEATIEIGKGLIISMERMTNTISGLPIRHQ